MTVFPHGSSLFFNNLYTYTIIFPRIPTKIPSCMNNKHHYYFIVENKKTRHIIWTAVNISQYPLKIPNKRFHLWATMPFLKINECLWHGRCAQIPVSCLRFNEVQAYFHFFTDKKLILLPSSSLDLIKKGILIGRIVHLENSYVIVKRREQNVQSLLKSKLCLWMCSLFLRKLMKGPYLIDNSQSFMVTHATSLQKET